MTLGPSAPVTASKAPKSRSCVKTTYPFCRAHAITSLSFARKSPTADQCNDSCPASCNTGTHEGDRFMSTTSFIQTLAALQPPLLSKLRRRVLRQCLQVLDTDRVSIFPPVSVRTPTDR